ncbi:CopD family protein [Bradyrhizobium elkanii]|uniref:CopD family protein n=2 Tax=Bradyrhizobium elkanii TaxID=29448 RepID=UPI00271519BA|nr:CopD family protein [Bradyrhizobium elkanii]WLB05547.1 CopD family protein [Bradyrhizobium elkanii]
MSEQYAKITPLGSKWFVPAAEFQLVRNAQRHNNSGINGRIDAAINTAVRSRPAGRIYWAAMLLKLGLFGLMLCLAASNRFWLVPALAKAPAIGQSEFVLGRLCRHIAAERILGLLVVGIVSLLGTLSPAVQGS